MVPKAITKIEETADAIFMEAGDTYLLVRPLGQWFWVEVPSSDTAFFAQKDTRHTLARYSILVCGGRASGYVLDAVEKSRYRDWGDFKEKADQGTRLDWSSFTKNGSLTYRSLYGSRLKMKYRPDGLRADGWIDGKPLDYDHWADRGLYDSPYLKIKNGRMTVTDGRETFTINLDNP